MDINARAAIKPFVLALDVGTSSVRASLYDARGREITETESRVVRSLETTADGGAEMNADAGVAQVAHAVDALLARAKDSASRIAIIAVASFWHSLVGVDERGRGVTPVFGWADTRAARSAGELRRRFDEREIHARTGCPFHASYWPAKLLWLRAEHSALYRSVAHWLSFSEYLALRFSGETKASISMASGTGLLDQKKCEWDEAFLQALNVSVGHLPVLAKAGETFTGLLPEYAKRWPTLKDARWFPAIGDGAASNIGANCIAENRAALMIGTSGAMRVMREGAPPRALPESLWCYRADHRRVLTGGALSDGGGLYSWMKETLALINGDDAEIERELETLEPDAHGLTLLPFWAGERSTGWHTEARGAILGLRQHTRPVEILRAAMEAVCYRFAFIRDALCDATTREQEIIASGGALVHSPVWTQMLADVLNRSVRLSNVREASSRGAALLALEATGTIKTIADEPISFDRSYEPDATRHAKYRAGLERHRRLYNLLVADAEIANVIGNAATKENETLNQKERALPLTTVARNEER